MKLRRPTELPIDHWSKADIGYTTMRVTSPFGWRGSGFHGALDIGNARLGDHVVAAADGKVLAVGNLREPWSEPTSRFASGNYGGLMVVLEHEHGAITIYAHLRSEAVSPGQRVTAGQRIGTVGDSGSAAPPPLGGGGHLHFGVQAPAAIVPPTVTTAKTRFGIGLDADPWPLITGTAFAVEDREDRLAAEVVRLRREKPRAAEIWHNATGLHYDNIGKPLRREWYLAGEALMLRRAPAE